MGQTQQPMGSSPLARPYNLQPLGGPAQNPAAQQNVLQQLTGTGAQGPMPQGPWGGMRPPPPGFQMPTPDQLQQADQLRAQMTAKNPNWAAALQPAGRLGGAIGGMRPQPPPGAPGAGPGGGKGAAPGQQLVKQQTGQLPGAPPPGAPGRGPGQAKGNPAQNLAMKQQIASLPQGIVPR